MADHSVGEVSKELNNRESFLINPRFQLAFMGFIATVALSFMIILLSVNAYFFWRFETLGHGLQLDPHHVIFQFLKYQKDVMAWLFLICFLTTLLLLATIGLRFSHRVAGPLHKLSQHMGQDLINCKLTPVQFRKNDYFKDIAEIYNKLAELKNLNQK